MIISKDTNKQISKSNWSSYFTSRKILDCLFRPKEALNAEVEVSFERGKFSFSSEIRNKVTPKKEAHPQELNIECKTTIRLVFVLLTAYEDS